MTILLPAMGVALGTFCVWLIVRIVNGPAECARQAVLVLTVLWNSFKRTLPWGIALAGIVVGGLWFVVEPRYRACAIVQITGRPETIVFTAYVASDVESQ